jgi:hypothetical protein
MSHRVSRDPNNYELRKAYYVNKRNLKKMIKSKLHDHKESIVDKLHSSKDPKEFWKLVEKLQNCNNGKNKKENNVPAAVWVQHFKNSMSKTTYGAELNNQQQEVLNFINKDDNWVSFN